MKGEILPDVRTALHPIVVGVDGSPESLRAAALAWHIAERAGARCRLVHAVPRDWPARFLSEALVAVVLADARERMIQALRRVVPGPLAQALEVRLGPPPRVLVEATAGAEFVVVGGRHHAALARSTARYLVRSLRVPVLVAAASRRRVARILAAVDLSPAAGPTLRATARLARAIGARLRLIHVVEPARHPMVVPAAPDRRALLRQAAADFAARTAGIAGVATRDRVIRRGPAAEAIAAEAARWKADLVVMGSHGRGFFDRLYLGSTTERLLNLLPAALLIVPAAGATHSRRTRRAG